MSTVLIIDDNEKNVELLKDFTESWGYETLCAYQGIEALKIAKQNRPDIIVLDVMLPGMSGFEVCTYLRSDPRTMDIPIIIVSALTSPEDRANGFYNGADNFLTKPVSYKELKAMMTKLLKQKQRLEMMEDVCVVLEKFQAVMRQWVVPTPSVEYSADKLSFYCDVLCKMGAGRLQQMMVYWTLRFQALYETAVQDEEKKKRCDHLMAGLQCEKWLVPLLEYGCRDFAERSPELYKVVQKRDLEDIAEYCFVIKRFHSLWHEYHKNGEQTLQAFRKEKRQYGYSPKLTDLLESSFEAREMQKLLSQQL